MRRIDHPLYEAATELASRVWASNRCCRLASSRASVLPHVCSPRRIRIRYNHRFTSDGQRTVAALSGVEGKRLKYRETR